MTGVLTSLMACEAVSGSEHCFEANTIVKFMRNLTIVKILLVWYIAYSVTEDKTKASWVTLGACLLSAEFENFAKSMIGVQKRGEERNEEE